MFGDRAMSGYCIGGLANEVTKATSDVGGLLRTPRQRLAVRWGIAIVAREGLTYTISECNKELSRTYRRFVLLVIDNG
jgi:hypothetical protein